MNERRRSDANKSTHARIGSLVIAVAFALLITACGGGSEGTTDPGTTDPAAAGQATTDPATAGQDEPAGQTQSASDVDCQALHEARMALQGAGGNLIYAEDAEFFSFIVDDPATLFADIETLRPYQDVEPEVFGPMREGLDNFQHDLEAARDGRFTEIAGGYEQASINSVLATLGC